MCPERREKLLHQSDFTAASTQWGENKEEGSQCFRRGGYYHIGAKQTGAAKCVGIPAADFKVSVDAEFTEQSDRDALSGVVFRVIEKNGRRDKFYLFIVQWIGTCALFMKDTDKWVEIVGYRPSEFINKNTGTNALTVEMVGEEITASVNGHVVVRATYRRLTRGDVGLYVSSVNEYCEARFRNFRLYSIENVEEANHYASANACPLGSSRRV